MFHLTAGVFIVLTLSVTSSNSAKSPDRMNHIIEESVPPEYDCPHGEATSRLYPFGVCVGDKMLPLTDDGCVELHLSKTITFFREMYEEIHICNNGLVAFDIGVFLVPPETRSKAQMLGHPYIAPYWSDIDTTHGVGRVYFQEVLSGETFSAIKRRVEESLALTSFDIEWSLVVTWYKVAAHPPGDKKQNDKLTNTFQLVLASDGPRLVGFYLYQSLGWTRAYEDGPEPVIGAEAGDNAHYLYAPQSFSKRARDMVDVTNVLYRTQPEFKPRNGVWLTEFYLRVDDRSQRSVLKCLQGEHCCVTDGYAFTTTDCVNYTKFHYHTRYIEDNFHDVTETLSCDKVGPGLHFNVDPTVCACDKKEHTKCRQKFKHVEL